jgi:Xaa-Pro aminopeptidase
MFTKETYVRRRNALRAKMEELFPEGKRGIALFIGNVEAPAQYRDNCYKWRQDSSWIYYFGIDEPCYAAVMDLDSGEDTVYADDFGIDDIIWMGPQPSVADRAAMAGIARTAPYSALDAAVKSALAAGRRVHFLPPSRYYGTLKLSELLGCGHDAVLKVAAGDGIHASKELVQAVISMRLVKEQCEIDEIDDAGVLGQEMHRTARSLIRPGVVEQEIVGRMDGVTLSKGWGVSFPTILTQHGETLHNHLHDAVVESGRLMVIDAGAENNAHYASDFTRTYPTGGRFTTRQREVYQIVCDCNELAFSLIRPGVAYRDVHLATARKMLEGLSALGLVKGDLDEMTACGIAGLFQPHGLGHNMGLDVHDMEDLGEDLVGYDPDQTRSEQLGLGSLRMARRLVPGNVITDEPGIYFIPALIELWKKEGTGKDFVNYAALEGYYDFGGIRLEDDVLVTPDGARRTGKNRLEIQPDDVEEAMRSNL